MLYEQLMMDNSLLTKFNIFKRLTQLQQTDLAVNQLADEMNISYQQMNILLTEIDQQLQQIFPQHLSILQGAGKIDCSHLLVTIDEYRYHLLQDSIPFQYIVYILNTNQPTIEDFCEQYYISRSTVSRKMLPVKQYVKRFSLRFTYSEANLIGDERVARVAFFHFIWLGTRGTAWPFKISREEVSSLIDAYAKYFPLSQTYLGKEELAYFYAIFLCRMRKKQFVEYDSQYNFLMADNSYYDFSLLNEALGIAHALPSKVSKAESSYIFFATHYSPTFTIEDDPSLRQTILDFTSRPNIAYKLTRLFLDYAKQVVFFENPKLLDDPLIIGNLLNVTFTLSVLKQPYPDLQQLIILAPPKSKTDDHLEKKIQKFFENTAAQREFHFIYRVQKSFVQSYKEILAPYYVNSLHSTPLKVGVAFEHNFVLVKKMYQFLNTFDFVEAATYQPKKNAEYDLIISSSTLPLRSTPDLPLYFWDLSDKNENFGDLYTKLQSLYEEKNRI